MIESMSPAISVRMTCSQARAAISKTTPSVVLVSPAKGLTPAAVLINPEGRIASPVEGGNNAIEALVARSVAAAKNSSARNAFLPDISVSKSDLRLGDPAPRFSLLDLQGNQVQSEQFVGRTNLLLFWAHDCSYCEDMRIHLDHWKENAPPEAPTLVILASGDIADLERSLGPYGFLTLLDPDSEIRKLYGASGAPTGILVDAQGNIASSVASGAPNVLALAGIFLAEPELELNPPENHVAA